MNTKKTILMILLIFLIIGVPMTWLLMTYHIVDHQLYPKNALYLDLREQTLSIEKYELLKEKMPETEIRWNVPFQEKTVCDDAAEVTVSGLSGEDAEILAKYLPNLRTVHGEECTDYEALAALREKRPDVTVKYKVSLDSTAYAADEQEISLNGITDRELQLLQYLPELKSVTVTGGEAATLLRLQAYCRERGISIQVKLQGQILPEDTETLTLSGLQDNDLGAISLLEELKTLHIPEPEASAEKLLQLREICPDVQISWEQKVCGMLYASGECPEELDLSGAELPELEELERQLSYFPEVKQVYLGLCGIDNEALAAFREDLRDQYKVVWMVQCGPRLTARTDDTSFMPLREGLPTFTNEEIYNLRYCEEMICIDIGHMAVSDISFAAFMPDLEYLILAHTQVYIIEPLRNCRKLKFLEVDYTPVCDLSALLDCTALEDLNVGFTSVPLDVVKQMTWLKNLWMIQRSGAEEMQEALPNTTIMAVGNASVANGWRRLPNYYAMRDALGMHYMTW